MEKIGLKVNREDWFKAHSDLATDSFSIPDPVISSGNWPKLHKRLCIITDGARIAWKLWPILFLLDNRAVLEFTCLIPDKALPWCRKTPTRNYTWLYQERWLWIKGQWTSVKRSHRMRAFHLKTQVETFKFNKPQALWPWVHESSTNSYD